MDDWIALLPPNPLYDLPRITIHAVFVLLDMRIDFPEELVIFERRVAELFRIFLFPCIFSRYSAIRLGLRSCLEFNLETALLSRLGGLLQSPVLPKSYWMTPPSQTGLISSCKFAYMDRDEGACLDNTFAALRATDHDISEAEADVFFWVTGI